MFGLYWKSIRNPCEERSHPNVSQKKSALRAFGRIGLVMYVAFMVIFVLTAQLRVVQLLDKLFGYVRYDDGYGEGFLMLFTVIAFFLGSIAVNVLMPIYKYIKNRFFKRTVAEQSKAPI